MVLVMQMFRQIQDNERFPDFAIFSDESTFHVSGKVSTHNCRISGSENPHVRDSLKVNVFCALSKEMVYGPFFMETTITGIVYLDMLQQFLIPLLDEDDQDGCIHFQHFPYYLGEVREYLSARFPGQWIGRVASIAWPPHSLDLTPLDFFFWGIR
jgi:hypothetical protein